MGLFSFVGGLLGGGSAKKASRKAEAAQIEYLNKALDEQRRQFDVTQENYAPATSLLAPSIGGLADLIGVNGDQAQAAGLVNIKDSPLYESLYRNGEEAVLQNASATGGIRGGNTQRSLADFGSDTFAQLYQQQMQQLAGLSGLAMGGTDSVAAFGQQTANNVSNIYGQQGDARASGLLTRGGINAQNWNNAGSFLDDSFKAIFGGGGF